MPATATLINNASTTAFTLPAGTQGLVLWNMSAAHLRIRFGNVAAASGAKEGIPIPAGGASDPKYLTHYFAKRLEAPMVVHIFQESGSNVTSGVGYELLND